LRVFPLNPRSVATAKELNQRKPQNEPYQTTGAIGLSGKAGFTFLRQRAANRRESCNLDFKTKQLSQIGRLDKPSFYGIAISPDEGSLIYSQWDRDEHRIFVMEHFR